MVTLAWNACFNIFNPYLALLVDRTSDAWSFQFGPKTVYISSTFSGLLKKEPHRGTNDKCWTLLHSQCWCLPPVMAGSMDIEDGLDRNAQESAEDFKCGTGSQANRASKAIVGFSMAILAGLPAWYHLITWCCSVVHTVARVLWYCSEIWEAHDKNDFAIFCLRYFVWHNLRPASGSQERCIRWRSQQTHHGRLKSQI